jgi:uncharacterized phage infection (PIP) family protein YhgE
MLTKRIVGVAAGALLVLPLGGGMAWAADSSASGPAPCTQDAENATTVAHARAALADAQSELDTAKTKLASAQDDLATAKAKVTDLQAQIAALPAGSIQRALLQAQLSSAQSDVATKKAAVDKAQTAVNNAQCKVDTARAALARARVHPHCTPAPTPTPTPAPETSATQPAPQVTHDQSSVTVVTRVSPTRDDNSVAVVSGHQVTQVPEGSASTGA